MKHSLLMPGAACAMLAAGAAGSAMADTINFAQYGAPGTSVPSGASGTTGGGVNFTISDNSGFTEYLEDYSGAEIYSFAGDFIIMK